MVSTLLLVFRLREGIQIEEKTLTEGPATIDVEGIDTIDNVKIKI